MIKVYIDKRQIIKEYPWTDRSNFYTIFKKPIEMDDIEYFVMGSDIQTKCLEENIFNFLLQLIDNRHFEFIIHDNIYPPGNPLINYERCKKLIK